MPRRIACKGNPSLQVRRDRYLPFARCSARSLRHCPAASAGPWRAALLRQEHCGQARKGASGGADLADIPGARE